MGGYSDSQTIFGIELYPEGAGHDWVCDGYFNIVYHCPQISYLYFHMNWGWDGSYNGWYAYNNWNIVWYNNTNTTYQYFLTFVHNIHP